MRGWWCSGEGQGLTWTLSVCSWLLVSMGPRHLGLVDPVLYLENKENYIF